MTAKHVIQEHKFEQTELIFPTTPPPQPKVKVPPPPKLPDPPKPKLEVQMEQPKINMPKIEPKPALKPLEMEAKLNTPQIKAAKPADRSGSAAEGCADRRHAGAVEHGEAFNRARAPGRNIRRHTESECEPAGNRGRDRQSVWRNAGSGGRAARSSGIGRHRQRTEIRLECRHCRQGGSGWNSRWNGYGSHGPYGGARLAPRASRHNGHDRCSTQVQRLYQQPTNLEVLSKPPVQYTSEARQLRVQGDVILRVTFTASGQVLIKGRGARPGPWTG